MSIQFRRDGERPAVNWMETSPKRIWERVHMSKFVARFVKDESGATAIEYGLIAALVGVVIVTGLTLLGTELNLLFTDVAGKI
jgi:pilus assembly protein Flp/PilA